MVVTQGIKGLIYIISPHLLVRRGLERTQLNILAIPHQRYNTFYEIKYSDFVRPTLYHISSAFPLVKRSWNGEIDVHFFFDY